MRDQNADITILTRPVMAPVIDATVDPAIHPVESEADLRLWQETSVTGWAHTGSEARKASRAFAAAAHALDNESMAVAFDQADREQWGAIWP